MEGDSGMEISMRRFFVDCCRGWAGVVVSVVTIVAVGCGCAENAVESTGVANSSYSEYRFQRVFEVAGRQGVATDGERYFVSGSTSLHVYSKDGELIAEDLDPFRNLAKPANHIGDIDVHDGEIYAGVEWFVDGQGRYIQIAIYDAKTLEYRRSIDWIADSGQIEVSAVAVDATNGVVWMTDWVNGSYVYRYDLATGSYNGKLHLRPVPQWQQGVTVSKGNLLITADDGDAEFDEADNLWLVPIEMDATAAFVEHARKFNDFRRTGEIEGVTVDPLTGELVVLANRGARIVLGMPKGLYPGYDREIHEVYVYSRP
jgi:hypothetical protein